MERTSFKVMFHSFEGERTSTDGSGRERGDRFSFCACPCARTLFYTHDGQEFDCLGDSFDTKWAGGGRGRGVLFLAVRERSAFVSSGHTHLFLLCASETGES